MKTGKKYVNYLFSNHSGPKNQKFTYVKQISEKKSESVGTKTTWECSFLLEENKAMDQCTPERSVFWFKTRS